MQFELTIKGDSFEDIAAIFSRNTSTPGFIGDGRYPDRRPEPEEDVKGPQTAKEVEPETPKKSRSRRADAAKQDTKESTSDPQDGAGPSATNDASPSDEKVTFEDLRAYASSLMDSGKVDGRAIHGARGRGMRAQR
jgi:hypothetical protein